jgi:hypothetical protein
VSGLFLDKAFSGTPLGGMDRPLNEGRRGNHFLTRKYL